MKGVYTSNGVKSSSPKFEVSTASILDEKDEKSLKRGPDDCIFVTGFDTMKDASGNLITTVSTNPVTWREQEYVTYDYTNSRLTKKLSGQDVILLKLFLENYLGLSTFKTTKMEKNEYQGKTYYGVTFMGAKTNLKVSYAEGETKLYLKLTSTAQGANPYSHTLSDIQAFELYELVKHFVDTKYFTFFDQKNVDLFNKKYGITHNNND